MSVSVGRRETAYDPTAELTGSETLRDAARMELHALSLEASGRAMEALQLMEKALQIRCQATPHSELREVCEAAERLITKSNAQGVKCFKDDDYDTAATLFGYALEMTQEGSFPMREAEDRRRYLRGVTLNNYGCMERRRGHFLDALAYMQQSMNCTGEQSPVAYLNMSAVQTQLRLCEDAAESAMHAMQNLGSAPEDPSLLAVAHHNLAMALEPLDPPRALEEYQSALILAQNAIGKESETTLTIERNMLRFLQAYQPPNTERLKDSVLDHLTHSKHGSKVFPHPSEFRLVTQHTTPLHLQQNLQSPVKNTQQELEGVDIFPHPFMSSAADTVERRKIFTTPMYHPPPPKRRSLVPLTPMKSRTPANPIPEHMYSQVKHDHTAPPHSRTTPQRRYEAPRGQTPTRNPGRLPPMTQPPKQTAPPPPTIPAPTMPLQNSHIPQVRKNSQKPFMTAGASTTSGNKNKDIMTSSSSVRKSSPLQHQNIPAASKNIAARGANYHRSETTPGRNSFTAAGATTPSSRQINKPSNLISSNVLNQKSSTKQTTEYSKQVNPVTSNNKSGNLRSPTTISTGYSKTSVTTIPAAERTRPTNPTNDQSKVPFSGNERIKSNIPVVDRTKSSNLTNDNSRTPISTADRSRSTNPLVERTRPPTSTIDNTLPNTSNSNRTRSSITNTENVKKITNVIDYTKSSNPTVSQTKSQSYPIDNMKKPTTNVSTSQVKSVTSTTTQKRTSFTSPEQMMTTRGSSPKPSSYNRNSANKSDLKRGSKQEFFENVLDEPSITTPIITNTTTSNNPGIVGSVTRQQKRGARSPQQGLNLISYMSDRLDMLVVDEEELERKHGSASIIQRAYRLYAAQKLLKEMRENRTLNNRLSEIRESIAARKIQKCFRKGLSSKWGTRRRSKNREFLATERHKAAIRIQGLARGWLTRKIVKRRKYFEKNSGKASIAVQCWWRQILAKRKLNDLKRRHEEAKLFAIEKERKELAATLIQTRWRAVKAERQTRAERQRAMELRKKHKAAQRNSAARKIQTWWRLHTAKAELQRLKEAQAAREARLKEHQRKIDAATKIQSFGRMIIVKKEAEPSLTIARINAAKRIREMRVEHQAASKIQRTYRFFYARQLLKRLRYERRDKLRNSRLSALVLTLQRIARGFRIRCEMGKIVANMENEVREYLRREEAIKLNDQNKEIIMTNKSNNVPISTEEEYKNTSEDFDDNYVATREPSQRTVVVEEEEEEEEKEEEEEQQEENKVTSEEKEVIVEVTKESIIINNNNNNNNTEKRCNSAIFREVSKMADEEREKSLKETDQVQEEKEKEEQYKEESESPKVLEKSLSQVKVKKIIEDSHNLQEVNENTIEEIGDEEAIISTNIIKDDEEKEEENEIQDEAERLSALAMAVSINDEIEELQRLFAVEEAIERKEIKEEAERLSTLSTAVSLVEEEEKKLEEEDQKSIEEEAQRLSALSTAVSVLEEEDNDSLKEEMEQEEIQDEAERLSALAMAVSINDEIEELQRLFAVEEAIERKEIKEEAERLSTLSTAVSLVEEEEKKLEEEDQKSIEEEAQRLSALSTAVSVLEEEEEEEEHQQQQEKKDESPVIIPVKEEKRMKSSSLSSITETTTTTKKSPASHHKSTSVLTEEENTEPIIITTLEAALETEREKRRLTMAEEKRLRQARDALRAKANEYRLRQIAAAETSQELHSLIPRPPLTRQRRNLENSNKTVEITRPSSGHREHQLRQTMDAAKIKEKAALNITRVARGYLDRRYARALREINMEYIDYRVEMDIEEPPALDHQLLDKFADMYQNEVEQVRKIRRITAIQSFLRALRSVKIITYRSACVWKPSKVYKLTLSTGRDTYETLFGFIRIIQAKKECILRKEAILISLEETKRNEAISKLNEFVRIIRSKKELSTRRNAIKDYLKTEEEADTVLNHASDVITRFFRFATAKFEIKRRLNEIEHYLRTTEAADRVKSFLQVCCAKKELQRRQSLAEAQRVIDINSEEVLDHAALQLQRVYRAYRARQLARAQREAKQIYWNSIQAHDAEITAAVAALAEKAGDEADLWASLGYYEDNDYINDNYYDDNNNEEEEENEEEIEWDVNDFIQCVVVVQGVMRGWLARRRTQELKSKMNHLLEERVKEEEKEKESQEEENKEEKLEELEEKEEEQEEESDEEIPYSDHTDEYEAEL